MFRHTSLTKGVTFDKRGKRWQGRFTSNGVHHYVGSFKEEKDAVEAVNQARINVMSSNNLRHEVKNELQAEIDQYNENAAFMAPIQEWDDLPLNQIKEAANKHGIYIEDLEGDARSKKTWVDMLNFLEVRPMTTKEPEIEAAVDEIEAIIADLDKYEKEDQELSDQAVLEIAGDEWLPCVIVNPDEPSYFWCNEGFIYTLYPNEGSTVWRYDETVTGNYKPIGVWNGPQVDENYDQAESPWQVSVDKNAGTYSMIDAPEEDALEEGEILEDPPLPVMSTPRPTSRKLFLTPVSS